MSELSEYLKKSLSRRGDRASLARRLKISEATVTRWVLGQTEPGFENYVQIADYFEIHPREGVRWAGGTSKGFITGFFPSLKKLKWARMISTRTRRTPACTAGFNSCYNAGVS